MISLVQAKCELQAALGEGVQNVCLDRSLECGVPGQLRKCWHRHRHVTASSASSAPVFQPQGAWEGAGCSGQVVVVKMQKAAAC